MEQKITNIILVDDHLFLREGLKKILHEESDFKVIGEASDHSSLFDILKNNNPDIIILDITLPGKNGIDILKDLKQKKISSKVLILSMHPEDRFAIRSFKAGALGYLTKESAPEELVKAIRTVLSGRKYVTKDLQEKLINFLLDDSEVSDKPLHESLSDREYEVFIKIALGKKVSQIAEDMILSVHTVNTYRARILEKMKMSTNSDLTHYAMQNHLID
jgi:two-component system, NarL family, invasion response regulator UvrY